MSDELLQQIADSTDREWLECVLGAARARLEWLERNRGPVRLACREGAWYAVFSERDHSGKRRVVKLGERLSPAAVLHRARKAPPQPTDYEIPKAEADRRRQLDRQSVGWIDQPGALDGQGRRYYSVPEYEEARVGWHRWKSLANDPLAMAYGITVNGMKQIREIEEEGYRLVTPDQVP